MTKRLVGSLSSSVAFSFSNEGQLLALACFLICFINTPTILKKKKRKKKGKKKRKKNKTLREYASPLGDIGHQSYIQSQFSSWMFDPEQYNYKKRDNIKVGIRKLANR